MTTQTTTAMTPRGRWLAALDMQPADRLPFWPKLDGSYPRHRTGRFAGWDNSQSHAFIGSEPPAGVPDITHCVRSRCSIDVRVDNCREVTEYITPSGRLTMVRRWDDASNSWHPIEHPVRDAEGIGIMTELYADQRWETDPDQEAKARDAVARIGESAATTANVGKTPLQQCIEYTCGVEYTHYLLADHPEAMAGMMDAMQRSLMECVDLMADRQLADTLWLIEDTSTTTTSVGQYHDLNLAQVSAVAERLRQADRRLVLHMCGHLKGILGDLATVGAAGFEAFTAPPVGNTTLADGRAACPGTCLIGGTHAALWLEPADAIIDFLDARLAELPHHRGLVLSSAGVMPPSADPEKIKQVCDWIHAYPARM